MGRSSRLRRAAAGTPRTCLFCVAKPSASLPQRKGCLQVSVDSIYNHQKPLQSHLLLSRGLAAIQPSCSCCLHLAAADPGGGWWPRRTSRGTDRQCHRGGRGCCSTRGAAPPLPSPSRPRNPQESARFPSVISSEGGREKGLCPAGEGAMAQSSRWAGGAQGARRQPGFLALLLLIWPGAGACRGLAAENRASGRSRG